MGKFLGNASIIFIAAAAIASAKPIQNDFLLKSGFIALTHSGVQPRSISRGLAKTTTLAWRQVASTHYYNTASSGNPAQWSFSSRDTFTYDAAGNQLLKKSSVRQSGWEIGDVESLDSAIYVGGKLSEDIFYYCDSGTVSGGSRTVHEYLGNGSVVVSTSYDWDDSLTKWISSNKDSMVFSAPIGNFPVFDLTNFVGQYMFIFNTMNAWNPYGSMTKINAESNATTLTMGLNDLSNTANTLSEKIILTFKSNTWTQSNLIGERYQKKPQSGDYFDMERDFFFCDSYGNDTLSVYCTYDTVSSKWDTSSIDRTLYTYDASGNAITTIKSSYPGTTNNWSITDKDVDVFAQIQAPVIRPLRSFSKQKPAVTVSASAIRGSAPDITELNLYNASGRLVASVKQSGAPLIALDLVSSRTSIPSGVYVVDLKCAYGKVPFALSIQR